MAGSGSSPAAGSLIDSSLHLTSPHLISPHVYIITDILFGTETETERRDLSISDAAAGRQAHKPRKHEVAMLCHAPDLSCESQSASSSTQLYPSPPSPPDP